MLQKKIFSVFLLSLISAGISNLALAQTPSERTAQAFFFEAEKAMTNEDYETALSHAEKAKETLGSNNALLESIRVRALYEMGQFEPAGNALIEFYELDPSKELNRSLAPIIVKLQGELDVIEKQKAETQAISDAIKAAGVCLVDAEIKGETKIHSREVLVSEKNVEFISIPSTFKTSKETVVIQPAAPKDSTFETVKDIIVVQEATSEFFIKPAEFEDTKIKVPLGVSVSGQIIEGEISRRTYLTKASSQERVIPAVTKTIQVKQIKKKGKSKTTLPAVTKTVTRRVVNTQPQLIEKVTPEILKVVEVSEEISPSRPEKVNAMCNFKEAELVVEAVKIRLKEEGYFTDLSEEVSDDDLDAALIDFQKKNELPFVAELTRATYEILKLSN